ncbi:MAG TPA: chemotaxis protein CheW [Pyrinomonadaceae bacterium]|nr:chemotaxis protein CheW [Pyrinomonadaceae bacterium]
MNDPQPERHLTSQAEPQLRDLFSFVAGGRTFAVPAEEVEGTADSKHVAALPQAPPAVVGVLCVRGRMLTTLDPVALLTGERLSWPPMIPCVVALRGDEQLALAAESFGGTITVAENDIEAPAGEDGRSHRSLIGISRHGGAEIWILTVTDLFAAAFQRRERRRRRF